MGTLAWGYFIFTGLVVFASMLVPTFKTAMRIVGIFCLILIGGCMGIMGLFSNIPDDPSVSQFIQYALWPGIPCGIVICLPTVVFSLLYWVKKSEKEDENGV